MNRLEARAQFAALVIKVDHEIELDRAALLIAAEEYPSLDVECYLERLDSIADEARDVVDQTADPLSRLLQFSHFFSEELGFEGNSENYYDVRNSFLNKVIDRRVGIPITLSVIYMEIARRIGLKLFGVGMPGHFIVKYKIDEQDIFIDPFHKGRLLSEEGCREIMEQMYGGEMKFRPEHLYAVTKKQLLTRILQNLKGLYASVRDYPRALGVVERMLLIDPDSPPEIRDRGLIFFAMERFAQALVDLEEYLRRAPEAEDAKEVRERIILLRKRQAQLN